VNQKKNQGPSFCDAQGNIAKFKAYEFAIMDCLAYIKSTSPGLIPEDVDVYERFWNKLGPSQGEPLPPYEQGRSKGSD
jgi:hypothetical protein